jgi:AcrR family transcriptional regulator
VARTVSPSEGRREEILEVAQRFFYIKGYGHTSIRDIIDEVGIAKGTFYHHFDSKWELLDALTERILQESVAVLTPMVQDPKLAALDKLQRLFRDAGDLKLANRALVQALLPVWYRDENAIMREKIKAASIREVAPLLRHIIRQGVTEGCFVTDFPDEIGEIVLQTSQNLSDTVARLFLADQGDGLALDAAERRVTIYEDAVARLLGAPAGSVKLVDRESLQQWFAS